jgi:hypothetical protein
MLRVYAASVLSKLRALVQTVHAFYAQSLKTNVPLAVTSNRIVQSAQNAKDSACMPTRPFRFTQLSGEISNELEVDITCSRSQVSISRDSMVLSKTSTFSSALKSLNII